MLTRYGCAGYLATLVGVTIGSRGLFELVIVDPVGSMTYWLDSLLTVVVEESIHVSVVLQSEVFVLLAFIFDESLAHMHS
jgi:hypothetical protein